jgi:hypothetical protein
VKKAYQISDASDYDKGCIIVYAEKTSEAKIKGRGEMDIEEYIDIRAKRQPTLDKYQNMDEIPHEEFLKIGWWVPCHNCHKQVYEKDNYKAECGAVYCEECSKLSDKSDS